MVGSVQDQETPEIFQSKFEVKSDTATSGKVKSKSSDRAVKRSTTRGYVPEHEATQDYTQVDQKLENVKSSTIRKSSTERPAVMSQNVGVLQEEDKIESMEDLLMKEEKVKEKRVRSESCERVETQPKCIGYIPKNLKTEDIDNVNIKEEYAQEKQDSKNKLIAVQQSKNIGFHPKEDSSQELGMNKMKSENISPKNTLITKGTASLNSKNLGFNPANITSEDFLDSDIKGNCQDVPKKLKPVIEEQINGKKAIPIVRSLENRLSVFLAADMQDDDDSSKTKKQELSKEKHNEAEQEGKSLRAKYEASLRVQIRMQMKIINLLTKLDYWKHTPKCFSWEGWSSFYQFQKRRSSGQRSRKDNFGKQRGRRTCSYTRSQEEEKGRGSR